MSRDSFLQQATTAVPEFKVISEQFLRKYTIAGKSESCTRNYLMQISKMVLHFKCSPLELSIDQMEEYLFEIQLNEKPSRSSFKHLVYGLRTLFTMFKNQELYLALPSIKGSKALPVVFSQQEIKTLLNTPKLLKHRVLFAVIYDCGLRISEVVNLRIEDLDFDRKQIHIRQSKHKKDRYVPMSDLTIKGFHKYLQTVCPESWVFNGKIRGQQLSRTGIRHAFRATVNKAGIKKNVCIHTLRHSYATHLLEMGLDIVSVKNQMGHAEIRTTMMYLHIAQSNPNAGFSPLSRIYPNV
ncbi:tyrosine-type recombinase/integrase [Plebeiibacterium marinum]|uniref:Site-specific integrase n=1 Tax=Plebeiibacterium marinum TaxID=2992111 RepID=A0AAE3SLZ6_9BACT|nr:tyrosine-type recombinase/integrase [Plebeiobacterium marinum]MCW3808133.1 site-specific integrase [Plebeiobacterium marinum]